MDCGVDGHQQSARHEVDLPVELPWAQPGPLDGYRTPEK
jgi:hypothetical protein